MKEPSPTARENARLRAAAWYAANKDRAAATMKAYRAANDAAVKEHKRLSYLKVKDDPAFKAKIAVQTKKAKATKPAYDRAYRELNAATLAATKAAWRAENTELIRATKHSYKARRRAQMKSGDSSRSVQEWLSAVDKVCVWCKVGCDANFHIDHFYPLARGGEHRVSNLVIACPTCNVRKSALMPEEFCARNGLDFNEIERHRCDVGMLTQAVAA